MAGAAGLHAEWYGEGSPPGVHTQQRIERIQRVYAPGDVHPSIPLVVTDMDLDKGYAL